MTPREKKLLDIIRSRIEETGVSPSYTELARAIGVKGRGRVWEAVDRLVSDGHLVKLPGRHRGIDLPTPNLAGVSIASLKAEIARRIGVSQ